MSTLARKVIASFSYRVATRRHRLILAKKCSTKKRDLKRSWS